MRGKGKSIFSSMPELIDSIEKLGVEKEAYEAVLKAMQEKKAIDAFKKMMMKAKEIDLMALDEYDSLAENSGLESRPKQAKKVSRPQEFGTWS